MKQQQNNPAPVPRKSYTLEDAQGFIYLSYVEEEEANIQAAIMAEECKSRIYVAHHTLH